MSTPSLRHAYPAFPSSQDTAHTLLHALENLEHKAAGTPDELPAWVTSALDRRGFKLPEALGKPARHLVKAGVEHALREWVPLIHTLLSEGERRRLVADVAPEHWPLAPGASKPQRKGDETELDLQLKRHTAALELRETDDGRKESNYEQFVRYLVERGHLNERGQQAMVAAFEIDRKAEKLPTDAPGCGGFLMRFAVELQQLLDTGDAATEALNKRSDSVYGQASDNGAFNEIVGSHSLMSKDTLTSVPFFHDARVLASVASSSVFTIMLQQVAAPAADRRLAWEEVLHHLIRFPPSNGGWERRALAMFGEKQQIPSFANLPELARLAEQSMRPAAQAAAKPRQSKREELEERYLRLEGELSNYRYPGGGRQHISTGGSLRLRLGIRPCARCERRQGPPSMSAPAGMSDTARRRGLAPSPYRCDRRRRSRARRRSTRGPRAGRPESRLRSARTTPEAPRADRRSSP